MELFLNLAWLHLAGALLYLWLQGNVRTKADVGKQFIAIVVLIAILFPVVSMSDDLLAVQNAFEADNYPPRDHLVPANNPPVQPALIMIAAVIFAGLGFGFGRFTVPDLVPLPQPEHPQLVSIGNRPPPLA